MVGVRNLRTVLPHGDAAGFPTIGRIGNPQGPYQPDPPRDRRLVPISVPRGRLPYALCRMHRLHPAVPALLALAAAGAAVGHPADSPPSIPGETPDRSGESSGDGPAPMNPQAVVPTLSELPLEVRIAIGATTIRPPGTATQSIALARTLGERLGQSAPTQATGGLVATGIGDPGSLGRTTRQLAAIRSKIRRLLRMNLDGDASRLVLLERSRDRFELADATLFSQAPLATRTAVLGLAEGQVVVLAWQDPDAASFLAATARALATASIIEGGLSGRIAVATPDATRDPDPAETPEEIEPTETPAPTSDRAPAWFLEGLASQLAAATASPNALEPRQREAGLRFLRSGGDPRRVFALPADDPQWIVLDGVAQSVAFLAVQRLAEDAPANLDRLIGGLRAGRSWPDAWRDSLGGTPSSLAERLARHHAVND